jgi:hypothetical protein
METPERELTQEEKWRNALYAPFEAHEYRVREGNKTAWGGIQWFVYVDREAVQTRLDQLFPFAWSLTFGEPIIKDTFVVVSAALSINGCVKEFNGGQRAEGRKKLDDDMVKGAYTDAFRRVASMWGIGLDLQSCPKIYTDAYPTEPKVDWKAKQACEDDAFNQFAKWLAGEPQGEKKPAEKAPIKATNGTSGQQPPQNATYPPSSAKNGQTNGKGTPLKGAEQFPNPLLSNSVYYNKGKDGAYMLFRGKDNVRQTVSSFGGREKLVDAMSFVWTDDVLDAIQNWESGKVYPIPETLVNWEEKEGHKNVTSLKTGVPA